MLAARTKGELWECAHRMIVEHLPRRGLMRSVPNRCGGLAAQAGWPYLGRGECHGVILKEEE
jgi:hypothetical protein